MDESQPDFVEEILAGARVLLVGFVVELNQDVPPPELGEVEEFGLKSLVPDLEKLEPILHVFGHQEFVPLKLFEEDELECFDKEIEAFSIDYLGFGRLLIRLLQKILGCELEQDRVVAFVGGRGNSIREPMRDK